jgi:hypothetical protein
MQSPFSMQNLLASLPGSSNTTDLTSSSGLVTSTPQINKNQLASGVQGIKNAKNEKLAFMLYALGGALKGDKNFVQNTLALEEMQEGKKKRDAKKKSFKEFLDNMQEGPTKDLAKVMGYENIDKFALESLKAETKKLTIGDYKTYLAEKTLKGIPFTQQDQQLSDYLQNLDPLEKFTNTIVEQQLAGLGIGGTVGSTPDPSGLPVFTTKEQAQSAGLKKGDQFKDSQGVIYTVN